MKDCTCRCGGGTCDSPLPLRKRMARCVRRRSTWSEGEAPGEGYGAKRQRTTPHASDIAPKNRWGSFSAAPPQGGAELSCGAYANIDRATSERFRKGDYPIDATLDLHGMNREKKRI